MILYVAKLILVILAFSRRSIVMSVIYNDTYDAQFLTELIGVRDSEYQVLFSDNSNLSPSELGLILLSVATSRS